jgi:hypothetical protein
MAFFDLASPLDLFRKMEADLAAFVNSASDSRLAFNFFVTAEHLPDWLDQRDLVRQHALLRVVSHLANGAKHFTLDPKRHTSVDGTTLETYFAEDYVEPGYVEDWLLVRFSAGEVAEFGTDALDARELGKHVLEFWRSHVRGA